MKPCRSISPVLLYVPLNSSKAWRSSSIVSKCRTQSSLFQRADEPLGAAIAFRCLDERGGAFDAEERDLLLEVVRHILRSVVMTDREAMGDVLGEPTDVPAHALADRFQRLEPVARELA